MKTFILIVVLTFGNWSNNDQSVSKQGVASVQIELPSQKACATAQSHFKVKYRYVYCVNKLTGEVK